MPISIIVPTKDRPAGLARAVESARTALPEGGEIVVVDDGSRVPAKSVLQGIGGAEVLVNWNDGLRSGPSAARNRGAELAKHPILLFLDDDDELLSDYPSRLLVVAGTWPCVSFGIGHRLSLPAGQRENVIPLDRRPGARDASWPLVSRLCGAGGLWIRRKQFREIGGFDEELSTHEDVELCMRLAKTGAVMWYDDAACYVVNARRSESDASSVTRTLCTRDRLACYERILHKHGELLAAEAPQLKRRYVRKVLGWRLKARFQAFRDQLR